MFTAVCLCVCLFVSVCPAHLVKKIPAEGMKRFECGFRKWLLPALAPTLLN